MRNGLARALSEVVCDGCDALAMLGWSGAALTLGPATTRPPKVRAAAATIPTSRVGLRGDMVLLG